MARWIVVMGLGLALACGDDDAGDAAVGDAASGTDASVDAGGGPDGSTPDAATADASVDGGEDASSADASSADASSADASVDGGSTDAATTDAGIMDCALATLRFTGGPLPQMTNGSGDDFTTGGAEGCPFPSVTGPDRAYALVAELGAGTYRVRVQPVGGVSWDPMVYVRASCDATECLAGSNLNGAGEVEQVDVTLDAGQVVYVIVDTDITSGDPAGGPFMIFAEKLP